MFIAITSTASSHGMPRCRRNAYRWPVHWLRIGSTDRRSEESDMGMRFQEMKIFIFCLIIGGIVLWRSNERASSSFAFTDITYSMMSHDSLRSSHLKIDTNSIYSILLEKRQNTSESCQDSSTEWLERFHKIIVKSRINLLGRASGGYWMVWNAIELMQFFRVVATCSRWIHKSEGKKVCSVRSVHTVADVQNERFKVNPLINNRMFVISSEWIFSLLEQNYFSSSNLCRCTKRKRYFSRSHFSHKRHVTSFARFSVKLPTSVWWPGGGWAGILMEIHVPDTQKCLIMIYRVAASLRIYCVLPCIFEHSTWNRGCTLRIEHARTRFTTVMHFITGPKENEQEWNDSLLERDHFFSGTTFGIACIKSFTTHKCIDVASHDDKCSKCSAQHTETMEWNFMWQNVQRN